MQCPECGHNVANGRTQCIYCGAALGDIAFTEDLGSFKKEHTRQVEKDGTVYEVTEERKEYNGIDDVPEDWQKKIAEAIQRGGGDISSDDSFQEQELLSVLSQGKTPRRRRLHPFILALIFFASAGVVGIVMWLLR